jgi:hypothetical protein
MLHRRRVHAGAHLLHARAHAITHE